MLGGGDLVPLTEIDNIMQQADLNGDGEVLTAKSFHIVYCYFS